MKKGSWKFFRVFFSATGAVITVLLAVAATTIFFSIQWMFQTWSNLTLDELVYHLNAPLEGTNEGMVTEYLNACVVPAILVLLFFLVLFLAFRRQKKYFVLMGAGILLSLLLAGTSVYAAWNKLGAGDYVEAKSSYSTFIDDYYVDPAQVTITFPEQKRNLIYIFLESMETTYADKKNGGAFDENIIPKLTGLAQENEDFSGEGGALSGGYSMSGTTWTMGAMFAHTSGLPLNISIEGNSMDTQESFFPGIITLGDILEQEGYSQTLLIGSDATFGGRRLYFTEHGNYDITDYNYALRNHMIPENYRVWWGYEDGKLFDIAKEKLRELAAAGEPFNLTMLTVDTHFEDGYVCEECPDTYGEDQYANVMACADNQVSAFVQWIESQDFYENTTIVLVGDHPTMDSDFCEDIDDEYVRKVYTAYINSDAETQASTERNYTTFDSFPTVLAALGAVIEGERLGLGTNLFSTLPTLTERFGIDKMEEELSKKSAFMEEIADLDETRAQLLMEEGGLPAANMDTGIYQEETGTLPVSVREITNIPGNIQSVMLAIWAEKDQSDLQWIQMEEDEEGYTADVPVSPSADGERQYRIRACVVSDSGEQWTVGELIESIE